MKGNGKGRLVFLRSFEKETRNAVQCLHDAIAEDLILNDNTKVSTTIAHIFPKIGNEGGDKNIFGCVKPEVIAEKVLKGVSSNAREIYVPGYMIYLCFWLKFLPMPLEHMFEKILFGDL